VTRNRPIADATTRSRGGEGGPEPKLLRGAGGGVVVIVVVVGVVRKRDRRVICSNYIRDFAIYDIMILSRVDGTGRIRLCVCLLDR